MLMKALSFTPIVTALRLSAGMALAGGYERVATKKDFLAIYDGKTTSIRGGKFVINKNGTTTGKVQGYKAVGKWAWQNGMFCRTLNIQGLGKEDTDCLVITQKGNKGKWTP